MSNINIFIAKSFSSVQSSPRFPPHRENGVTFPVHLFYAISLLTLCDFSLCLPYDKKKSFMGETWKVHFLFWRFERFNVARWLFYWTSHCHPQLQRHSSMSYMLICLFKRVLSTTITLLAEGVACRLPRYHTFILFIAAQNHKIVHNTIDICSNITGVSFQCERKRQRPQVFAEKIIIKIVSQAQYTTQ